MAVVTYKCDVCERTVERVLNKQGLTFINRCVITDGCKGSLHKISTQLSQISPNSTDPVNGLVDWTPRRVVHTHYQTIPSSRWTVTHNLGVIPSVQLFVDPNLTGVEEQYIEILPEDILPVTSDPGNQLEIIIPDNIGSTAGVAQCIARTTAPSKNNVGSTQNSALNIAQLTSNLEIVLAKTLLSATVPTPSTFDLAVKFVDPDTLNVTTLITTFTKTTAGTPWQDANRIFGNGKVYELFTTSFDFSADFIGNNIGTGAGIYFTETSGSPITADDDMLILLANAPFEIYDKIVDRYIDISNLTVDNATTSIVIGTEELTYNSSITEPIYPAFKIIKI